MHYVNCNLCGRDQTELVNQGPDLLLQTDTVYRLVRCRHCGLIYQNPQLAAEEIAQHYPEDYLCYERDVAAEPSWFTRLSRRHALVRRCRRVERHCVARGALLDIGCATGLFMAAMCDRGWQVAGVDTSPYAADYARETFGLDVVTGTLADAAYPRQAFDVVNLGGVLEHVKDPKALLAEVARVVKPGGLVIIEVPNPACVERWVFGAAWIGWDRPRHLHIFTNQVLKTYLDEAGLACDTIESFNGRLRITLLNVEFWGNAHGITNSTFRRVLALLYNWPLRALTWPLYWLAGVCNQLSHLIVFARRVDPC